jgi:large subunit ribosomal protein L17
MYKRIKGKKFSRKTDQRRAFMKSLAANLILREKIQTTKVRARQTANLVERLITKAKKNDLAGKKALFAALPSDAATRLFMVVAPRFNSRNGGYTRVVSLGQRLKDGAPMAIVELLDRPAAVEVAAKPKDKKNKTSVKKVKEAAKKEKKAEKKS